MADSKNMSNKKQAAINHPPVRKLPGWMLKFAFSLFTGGALGLLVCFHLPVFWDVTRLGRLSLALIGAGGFGLLQFFFLQKMIAFIQGKSQDVNNALALISLLVSLLLLVLAFFIYEHQTPADWLSGAGRDIESAALVLSLMTVFSLWLFILINGIDGLLVKVRAKGPDPSINIQYSLV